MIWGPSYKLQIGWVWLSNVSPTAKPIQQSPLQLNPQSPNPNPILLSTIIGKRVLPKKKKKVTNVFKTFVNKPF